MKNMTDKKKAIKEFILNNPNLSGSEVYNKTKGTKLGIRKTDLLKIYRETKDLSEPTLEKREASIPIKHRTDSQKYRIKERAKVKKRKVAKKPPKVPFDQTKFGRMTKDIQKTHGLSEKKAIKRVRALLKIPRKDYWKLNRKDLDILIQYGY